MKNHYKDLIDELETQIRELSTDLTDPIVLSEKAIELILSTMAKMKKFILEYEFSSMEAEIKFFKVLKPQIVSKLIYYNAIYKIETKRPYGGEKNIKEYLNIELAKLKRFFDNNLEFYKYYRTGSTYLDNKYFVRGKYDIKLSLDTYYFESDPNFCTTHDFKVAKIIANDLIQLYLEDQLYNRNQRGKCTKTGALKWTGSKSALVELIYALNAVAVFNHGNADIKMIAQVFEKTFDIDLSDIYHTYLHLRNRKIDRTKFLHLLIESLERKMDDFDDK